MTAPNRRGSRVNQPRNFVTINANPETMEKNDWFSIEGYGKHISDSNPVVSKAKIPKNKTSSVCINNSNSENQINFDHSQCTKSIDELKQQLEALKKENALLDSDLRATSMELSNSKIQVEKVTKENSVLQSMKTYLENEILTLKKNLDNLLEEFNESRAQWEIEKDLLEKSLKAITKELENKIIGLRAKHELEVQSYEEKNRLLKIHLADILKMRSDERQFELDRISNDLEKSQTNEENLRIQFNKLVSKLNKNSKLETQFCGNCLQSLIPSNGKESNLPFIKRDIENFDKFSLDKKVKLEGVSKSGSPHHRDHR